MKIEMLYPEICNLYGDPGNIMYLEKSLPECEVIKTALNDTPKFISEDINLVYMGPMSESSQELVLEKLFPIRDKIIEKINSNMVFLITGNALEIFGKSIECEDGTSIKCLEIFSTVAKRKMLKRYNGLFLGKFYDLDIVGFKSQFTHSYDADPKDMLFNVVRGSGINPNCPFEGLHRNNFFATYVTGPLLILNPPFTKYIMKLMGAECLELAFEETAIKCYKNRLLEFQNPNTGFEY